MKNPFEGMMGNKSEQEKNPLDNAKEALERYLTMLDEETGEKVEQKEGMANVEAREKSVLSAESIDEIRDIVRESIDLLDKGDFRRAMAFLNARELNLRNYYVCEDYFEDATRSLREHINEQLENGNINFEDAATIVLDLKAEHKMRDHKGKEDPDELIGENITLYLMPSGKIGIKKENGEMHLEDRRDNKWIGFFQK